MKTTERLLTDGQREVTVCVSGSELADAVAKAQQEGIGSDETRAFIMDGFSRVVLDAAEPIPLTTPVLACDEEVTPGQDFRFTITYMPARTFSLAEFPALEARVQHVVVDDALIDAQIERMVKADPLVKGRIIQDVVGADSIVEMYIKSTRDGEIFGGLTGQREYQMGSLFMPEGFEAALLGGKAGDVVEFTIDIQDRRGTADASFPVDMEISIKQVFTKDAKQIDDRWVRRNFPSLHTVCELREFLKSEMSAYVDEQTRQFKLDQAMRVLRRHVACEMPDDFFRVLYADSKRLFEAQLAQDGISLRDYVREQKIGYDDFELNLMADTRERFVHNAVLQAVADYFDIEVTQDEVDAYCERMALSTGSNDPGEFKAKMYKSALIAAARNYKAAELITERTVAIPA